MIKILNQTTKGIKEEIIYNVSDFPYELIDYKGYGGSKKPYKYKRNVNYIKDFATLDIETTTIIPDKFKENPKISIEKPYAYMYLWQMCIGENVVMGRYWSELIEFINNVANLCLLSKYKRMVVYVHYLNYETQFLQSFFNIEEMFAKDIRQPVVYYSNGLEFRCSWILSNMSLKKLCENSKLCIHRKLSGEKYNFKKIRTPKDKLHKYNLCYAFNDVKGLHECIEDRLIVDDLGTIPLTSTGYVRRDVKIRMNKEKRNRSKFVRNKLNLKEYELCKKILRGGDTHACRYWSGMIVDNVESFDKQSSYIEAMLTGYYPDGKFTKIDGNIKEKFYNFIDNYCVIAKIGFINIRMKSDSPNPYIDIAHVERYKNIINDEGRVLAAEYIEYYLTEIDFKIIEEIYNFDKFYVIEAYFCERGELPKEIKEVAIKYYEEKTKLRGIKEQEYEYNKKKDLLCSISGMMITDIIHDEIIYEKGKWKKEKIEDEEKKIQKLNEFYKNRSGFLSYQYGIYVLAHARKNLYDGIKLCGSNLLYWDTDCVKFKDEDGHIKELLEDLNKKIIEKDMKGNIKAVAYKDGIPHYLGTWEKQKRHKKFKAMGAKKYCYIDEDDIFHITVAGLDKELGAKAIKNIDKTKNPCKNFDIGIILEGVNNTNAYYHDDIIKREIEIKGTKFMTGSNVGIIEAPYTIGITNEYYQRLFEMIEEETKNNGKNDS